MNIYGTQVDFDKPLIFIGEATSSTNICDLYSSATCGRVDVVRPAYIHRITASFVSRVFGPAVQT
jgi:hypothetical protein